MNKIKTTNILHVTVQPNKRLIFVSDIHGDLNTFKVGLEKINFNEDDYLFILGDTIEKGNLHNNLKTIQYIMELTTNQNVYIMTGNCDEVLRLCYPPVIEKDKFLYFIINKQFSILNDMAYELNIPIYEDMDIDDFMYKCVDNYKEIFEFIDKLSDVIYINDNLVLVHAGINDLNNIDKEAIKVLKNDRFYEKANKQEKLMIVGHYPTRNYRKDLPCVNPLFDYDKQIISIDGGNNVVDGGQINFVILESINNMNFSYYYVDHYPKHIMKCNVKYNIEENISNITFGENEVEIVYRNLDFYYVRHLKSNSYMWIYKENLYCYDNKYYSYDGTNLFLSVNKGDEVSVIIKAKPYSMIKKEGMIGMIETKYLDYDI